MNIGRGRDSQAGTLDVVADFPRGLFHVVSCQRTSAFHSSPPPCIWGALFPAGPLVAVREMRMKEPKSKNWVVVRGRMTLKGADEVGLVLALAKLFLATCLGITAIAYRSTWSDQRDADRCRPVRRRDVAGRLVALAKVRPAF